MTQSPNRSMSQQPHKPAAANQPDHEPDEGFQAVAQHFAGSVSLRDAKDDGGKQRKYECRAEVRELDDGHHDFFPMAIWCASTALIRFSRPATIMNLVP